MRQLLEESRKLIRLRSVSSEGNEELGNHLVSMLESRGFKTIFQQVTHSVEGISRRQFNVLGILGDPLVDRKTKKGLLLVFPIDTSSPGAPEAWTETRGDPYAALLSDGKLCGLGAAGSKIEMICAMRVLEKYRERKLKMPIYLVGLCGNEMGLFGARYLIKSLALNPKHVLVAGPTRLTAVDASKAAFQYRVTLTYQVVEKDAKGYSRRVDLHSFGKMSHAANPDQGVNAASQLIAFLELAQQNGFDLKFTKLTGGQERTGVPDRAKAECFLNSQQFEDFKRFFRETVRLQGKEKVFRVELGGLGDAGIGFLPESVFRSVRRVHDEFRQLGVALREQIEERFDPPYPTMNLSIMKQVPHGIEMVYDVRLLPGQEVGEVVKGFEHVLKEVASHSPNMNISGVKELYVGSLGQNSDPEWTRIITEALASAKLPQAFGTTSLDSCASLFSEAGYPAVVFGPGIPGATHAPNESVEVENLEKAYLFYDRLVERVCL